ncbi:hypothetical protein AMTRI_Chr02g215660 [Amborella trichopoda]
MINVSLSLPLSLFTDLPLSLHRPLSYSLSLHGPPSLSLRKPPSLYQPLKPLGLSITSLSLSAIEALSSHIEGWTPLSL